MAFERLLASFLRSNVARRPRSLFYSAPKPSSRPSLARHFIHRFAAHYATSAAAEAPLPSKTALGGGPGGKITDEFTGQGCNRIEMPVNSPLTEHEDEPSGYPFRTKMNLLT